MGRILTRSTRIAQPGALVGIADDFLRYKPRVVVDFARSRAICANTAAPLEIGGTRVGGSITSLRNAPTRLMKNLGYGKDYRYAHDETNAYAAGETYFPEDMPAVEWYRPVARGLEIRIGEKLAQLRELDRQARAKKD